METLCKRLLDSTELNSFQPRKKVFKVDCNSNFKKLENVITKNFYKTNNFYWSNKKLIDAFSNSKNINYFESLQSKKQLFNMGDLNKNFILKSIFQNSLEHSVEVSKTILNICQNKNYVLPEVTKAMMDEVEEALIGKKDEDLIVEGFKIRITKADFKLLQGLTWLNDEIVNFYMQLLNSKSLKQNYPNFFAFNSFFYKKLLEQGPASLYRWTKNLDIFTKDFLIFPIHSVSDAHWTLAVVNFFKKSISYYDSLGYGNEISLNTLKNYLHYKHKEKNNESFNWNGWIFKSEEGVPQQNNGSDCGVFLCVIAEHIASQKALSFSQKDIPYFRKKISYEIFKKNLL